MQLSSDALITLSQIIPILLLAAYFDKEVLDKIRTYNDRIKYYWLGVVTVILIGEFIAVMGVIQGPIDGVRGYIVLSAFIFALFNLLSIAAWKVLGFDLVSGLPDEKKRKH